MRRLAAVCFCLVFALLIGARFDASWAGGKGYAPAVVIRVEALEGEVRADRAENIQQIQKQYQPVRGEKIETTAGSRTVFEISSGTFLALDENTSVTLDRLESSRVSIRLWHGRVLAIAGSSLHEFRITTNHTASWIQGGAFTVINYDFLETISVAPIDTAVSVIVEPQDAFVTSRAVSVHETTPVKVEDVTVNLDAIPFYDWAQSIIPPPSGGKSQ